MLAGAIHMMQGTPYIYQGEELGMTNAHFTSIDQYRDVESLNYYEILLSEGKTKEEAIKILAERSRDNSRTPMQWSDKENAGFTTGTPWIQTEDNYRQINVEAEEKDEDSILNFYRKLITLRKEMPVISKGKIKFIEEENEGVLAYTRTLDDQKLVVFCNLKEEVNEVAYAEEKAEKLIGKLSGGRKNWIFRMEN